MEYKIEHTAHEVVEELKLNGFDAEVINNRRYKINTIAGSREMSTYMADYYRALDHIGGMISQHGLQCKLDENKKD